jgi:hypothetical protein
MDTHCVGGMGGRLCSKHAAMSGDGNATSVMGIWTEYEQGRIRIRNQNKKSVIEDTGLGTFCLV